MPRITVDAISRSVGAIPAVFLDSPQFEADELGRALGCRVVVKVETMNPIRSFKGRGGAAMVASVPAGAHIVVASAGNFGQGLAFAARDRQVHLSVFAAQNANPVKVTRMRELGAEVILEGDDFDGAKLAAARAAAAGKGTLVIDGLDLPVTEGAGTIGLELATWPESFDDVIVPIGNGALLGGVGTWIRSVAPATRLVGVVAAGAPSMALSLRRGAPIATDAADTIADGIAVRVPVPEAVDDLVPLVDDLLLVDDATMIEAMRLAHRHLGLVLEPAGACGIAAMMVNPGRFAGRLVATILTGGNLTHDQMDRWLGGS